MAGYVLTVAWRFSSGRRRRAAQRYAFWRALGSQAVQGVLERLDKAVSRKVRGSNNVKAGCLLVQTHIRVDDKQRDFHFQLAQRLGDDYNVLVFEVLNVNGMERILGEYVAKNDI